MQLICEAYHLMSQGLGMTAGEMHAVFAEWNKGVLDSYLIEITRRHPGQDGPGDRQAAGGRDPRHRRAEGHGQVDLAGRARSRHRHPADRRGGVRALPVRHQGRARGGRPRTARARSRPSQGDRAQVHRAICTRPSTPSKICSYAQGYQLLRAASAEYKWNLNFGEIALMWRGGCIIRAQFLGKIKEAFDRNPSWPTCCWSPTSSRSSPRRSALARVIKTAVDLGIPVPAMGTALNYYDSYRCERLPATRMLTWSSSSITRRYQDRCTRYCSSSSISAPDIRGCDC